MNQIAELEPKTRLEYFLNQIAEGGGSGESRLPTLTDADNGKLLGVQNKRFVTVDAPSGGGDGMVRENVSGRAVSLTPADNHYYVCGTLDSLTVTSNMALGAYIIRFVSGSTATVVDLPQTLEMPDGIVFEASTRYEINVLDGSAVVYSWAVAL